jgi:hypothetical protein
MNAVHPIFQGICNTIAPPTAQPTQTQLSPMVADVRQHLRYGGAIGILADRRSPEGYPRWRVCFYERGGRGAMGEHVWRFYRCSYRGLSSAEMAQLREDAPGCGMKNLDGVTIEM